MDLITVGFIHVSGGMLSGGGGELLNSFNLSQKYLGGIHSLCCTALGGERLDPVRKEGSPDHYCSFKYNHPLRPSRS